MSLVPFERAPTSDACADCGSEPGVRCARHDANPRCPNHGDYLADDKSCASCMREAVHYDGCDTACGGTWVCAGCNRLVGFCGGCSDDMPELCDECWNDVTKAREFAQREAS
jgi:hypothetical protein